MTGKSTPPKDAVSRRHFLLSTSLASTALGLKPLTGLGAPTRESHPRGDDPGRLCLWSDRPAKVWMTEAYPIGNGPMGAMLFGGTAIERVQFNEISLWSGTRMAVEGLDDKGQDLGAHHAFDDVFIHLGHDFAKVTAYRQELDIDRAVHLVTYEYNGFEYEAQLLVLNKHEALTVKNDDAFAKNPWNVGVPGTSLAFERCDRLTLILGAGTNFLQDHTKQWLGAHPHAALTKRVASAARRSVAKLLARHVRDYQSLFRRFSLDVGTTAPELLAKTNLPSLEAYVKNTRRTRPGPGLDRPDNEQRLRRFLK